MITRNDQGNSQEESSPKLASNQEYKSSVRLLIRRSLLVVVVCVSSFNLYLLVWLYSNVLSLQISGFADNKQTLNNKITVTDDISKLSVSALSLSNSFSSQVKLASDAIANELVRAVEGVKAKSESIDISGPRVKFKVLKGNKFETVLSVEDKPAYISTSVPLIAKFNDDNNNNNNNERYLNCSKSNICFVDARNSTLIATLKRNKISNSNKQELIAFKGKTISVSQILGINNNDSNVCIKKVPNHNEDNNNFVAEDKKYNLCDQRIDTKLRFHSSLQKLKLFSVSNANFVCNKSVELLAKGKLYIKSHENILAIRSSHINISSLIDAWKTQEIEERRKLQINIADYGSNSNELDDVDDDENSEEEEEFRTKQDKKKVARILEEKKSQRLKLCVCLRKQHKPHVVAINKQQKNLGNVFAVSAQVSCQSFTKIACTYRPDI